MTPAVLLQPWHSSQLQRLGLIFPYPWAFGWRWRNQPFSKLSLEGLLKHRGLGTTPGSEPAGLG